MPTGVGRVVILSVAFLFKESIIPPASTGAMCPSPITAYRMLRVDMECRFICFSKLASPMNYPNCGSMYRAFPFNHSRNLPEIVYELSHL